MIDVSPETELEMGLQAWEDVKAQFQGSILPSNHPVFLIFTLNVFNV